MDNNEIDIFVFAEKGDVAAEGARLFVEKAAEAIAERGRFGVVLAGGSTPAAMYQLLQQEAWQRQVDWERVHVFWGDERFVAPDHTLNSWREATELFLGQVPIPAENVWPMPTVGLGVGEAAEVYESRLRSFFGQEEPRFDLIFLGMGADGHTASLFPGRAGVLEEEAWVVGVEGAPKAPPVRLTMTLPLLRQGRQIVMMVTGEAKKEAVFETLLGENDVSRYPLQGIEGGEGEVRWLLDEGAAALLLNSS